MRPPKLRSSGGKNLHEWISALGTLLVLSGIYASMDNFASFAPETTQPPSALTNTSLSVAPPYWNTTLKYGFRSIAGDTYMATTSPMKDVVSVQQSTGNSSDGNEITVSYYKNTNIEDIDKNLENGPPRAYSKLSHGVAVIEGNLDSARAKTIFSTLHSE